MLPDVIIAIAPYVREFMKPDSTFICSGIILERLDEVKAALTENGLNITKVKNDDDDWGGDYRETAALSQTVRL